MLLDRDQELIYYSGYAHGHKIGVWDGDRQLRVATLRRDGFVSYDAGATTPGTLRTWPFGWNALRLTANAQVHNELGVRLLDKTELPVPGSFFCWCRPLTNTSLAQETRWTGTSRHRCAAKSCGWSSASATLYAFTLIEKAGEPQPCPP